MYVLIVRRTFSGFYFCVLKLYANLIKFTFNIEKKKTIVYIHFVHQQDWRNLN